MPPSQPGTNPGGGNIGGGTSSTPTPEKSTFAVYSADDQSLHFYNRPLTPAVGGQFNGKTVTAVYTGLDSTNYLYQSPAWKNYLTRIASVTTVDAIQPRSIKNWFCGMSSLSYVDLSKMDTGLVTDMYMLFDDCESITDLDLRNFNTSNVTDMGYMLGSWNTSNVTTMELMFTDCKSLTTLDLSSFNTRKCTNSDVFGLNDYLKTVKPAADFFFVSDKGYSVTGLPHHNTTDVPEWDGNWFAASTGIGYGCIPPAYKADTYYAAKSMLRQ